MKFTPPERISLKLHPELNERWVQELIAADPSILGLGEDYNTHDEEQKIETAKLACFLNFLRPSLIRVVRRKNIERTKRKIGVAAAMKAMILKIIVHSQCRVTRSFDHLVGACGEAGRHFEPEYFGTLEVDNKLELGGLIDRQIGGLLALENPGDIEPSAAIAIRDILP